MAYEILVNTATSPISTTLPANKPQYTPAKIFKKAFRSVRQLFKMSIKHQRFLNETIAAFDDDAADDGFSSEEEMENYENEIREAQLQRL
ncbi:bearded [Haematobia irritans]|uniref:bearded n=1 Tax=Haematobia irritans TaxID=7368 RepID=UPI003F502CF0